MSALPEGWVSTQLSSVTEVVPSINPHGQPNRRFRYIDISAIDNRRFEVPPSAVKHFAGRDAPSRARRSVQPGDVLFSNVRTYLRNIALLRGTTPADVCSTGFTVLRPNGAILPEYLLRYVLTHSFIDAVTPTQTGTHYPATSDGAVLSQTIPLAPLAEQRRIAEKVESLLDLVGSACERLEKIPLAMRRFRETVLADACCGRLTAAWRKRQLPRDRPSLPDGTPDGGRSTRRGANLSGENALLLDEEMPELPESWTYARADRVVAPGTVITYGIVLPGPEVRGGVPYVRQQDIEEGVVRVDQLRRTTPEIAAKHERSSLKSGDVLLCIIRNLRVAIVPKGLDGANLTQGTVRMRPNDSLITGPYLGAYLASRWAQGWMKRRYFGMDMPRINVEDARAVPIALPHVEEQREIIRRVHALFALAETIERRVATVTDQTKSLKDAILAKAFNGELVLIEAELARQERREYEPASVLLERSRTNRSGNAKPTLGAKNSAGQPRKAPGRRARG